MDKSRLNEIFNDASEPIIIYDSEGALLYFNTAARNLLAYSDTELEEKSLFDLVEKEVHKDIRAFVHNTQEPHEHVIELKAFVIGKRQHQIPASLLFSTITHEKGNIHMLVVEPLVDKGDEHHISDYKLLADNLPDLVSLYNAQHRCIYVNPVVSQLYGYRQSEYIAMNGIFGLISKGDQSALLQKIQVVDNTNTAGSLTVQSSQKEGGGVQVQITLRKVFDEQGSLRRIIIFEKAVQVTQEEEPVNMAESQPVPMLLLNADWQLNFINPEASRILEQNGFIATHFSELLHPEDFSKVAQEKPGIIYNGIISTERQLRFRKSGSYVAFRTVFDKFFDESGHLAYITVRLYPVIETGTAEPGRSHFLKLVAENVDEVVCFFQQDFSLRYISPAVHQALGYSREELEGENIFSLIHPEDRTEVEVLFRQPIKETSPDLSCRFRTVDGDYRELELKFRMLEGPPEDDRMLPFLALLRHVPQLRDIANPLALFNEISDHLSDALALISLPSMTISKVNTRLLSTFDAAAADMEGRAFLSLFQESAALTQLENALLKADDAFHKDMLCVNRKQEPFWANVAVSFLLSGEDRYALMRITDISEQKRREQKLQEARQEAEDTLKSREEFLSTMSHEIRTPLNAILGMTHLMLQGKPREDQLKLLQTLKFSGDSLTALINDVLDFSKIEAGKLEFAQDDFNLREFLHGVKLTYKNLAQEKGLIFRTLLEEELPAVVNGDVHRLGQILNNLLNNAIKFTEDGYIILSIYVEAEEEVHYELLFEVADTGIGIPKEKQSVIFDPYQQASQRTSRYFGGTGLGLSIVKKLVDLSEGKITMESEEGKGTTFKVRLKFAKPANGNGALPTEISDRSFIHEFQPLDGLKVLYVEDVIPNQFLMEGLCDTWHIQLDTALNGLEALEKVKQNRYDLILMDIHMPEMDGFEAAQEIRNLHDPHYSHVPILALSASVSDRTRQRIWEKGMDDYIAKPINPKDLHQKLSQYATVASTTILGDSSPDWEEADSDEIINLDSPDFSQLRDLYFSDRDGYVAILQQVLKLIEESTVTIIQALENGREQQFRSSGHKIMTYVRLMKLQTLQDLLEDIKDRFESYSQSPREYVRLLDVHFRHFVEVLRQEIREYS